MNGLFIIHLALFNEIRRLEEFILIPDLACGCKHAQFSSDLKITFITVVGVVQIFQYLS